MSSAVAVWYVWVCSTFRHTLNDIFHIIWLHLCQCQSKFFSVAKIAELSPQRRSRVIVQNQEMIVEKEMFLGVDEKQDGMEMTKCQMAVSSIGVTQQLERSVDRRLWAGMTPTPNKQFSNYNLCKIIIQLSATRNVFWELVQRLCGITQYWSTGPRKDKV